MQNRLEVVRKAKGLTRTELAKAAGVHWVTVYRWETHQMAISLDSLVNLARILTVQPTDILPELVLPAKKEKATHA